MNIKEKVRKICMKVDVTKTIYQKVSWIKGWIYYAAKMAIPILRHKTVHKKPVFLIFTPQHANLGDHAIAYAEKNMLDNLQLPFFEITGEQLRILDYYKMLGILDNSLILINGGGNIGTLWPDIEKMNRRIVIKNPHAVIVILPNTMFYGGTDLEQKEFEISKKIYNSHSQLYFYARENISYVEMKKVFNNVKMIPDLVLSLDYSNINSSRNGAIMCIRHDTEAILSREDIRRLDKTIKKMFNDEVLYSDTVLEHSVPVRNREDELNKKINEFCTAELVITDRLHGMIFCAITGTNCIVLNSKSPKLRGCYEWIKHLGYVRFVEDIDDIESEYNQMKLHENIYDNREIMSLIKELEQDIMNIYFSL